MEQLQKDDLGTESYLTKWKTWEVAKGQLMSGETLSAVTKWLKDAEPEAKGRSDNALMKVLSRLRTELKKTEAQSKLAELRSKADEAASKMEGSPEQVESYVDVLESLMALYLLQMDRIKMGRSIEEKVKYLIARMTQDIGEAREILKFMFEVQQELGLAKRRPLELTGKFAVLSFEQRQRVGKVLDLVKQKVLAKQHEEALVTKAAEETLMQAVDGDVIDVLPTDQTASQRNGQVIPFVDKFAPGPEDPVLADLPFELDDEEPREE